MSPLLQLDDHLMHRGGRDLKVSLHVGFSRRPPVYLGVVVNEGEKLPLPWREVVSHSQFSLEGFVEDRGQHRVEFGGGFSLERFQPVHFCL